MDPRIDVLCVGEALVDFLPETPGHSVRNVETWRRCPGGMPVNVALGAARLGARSALLGVVGEDEFGHFLCERLAADGVDVSRLRRTPEGHTGLAFVSLNDRGERSFVFNRTNAAGTFLDHRDVDVAFVSRARVVHFGSASLVKPRARAAVLSMIMAARKAGAVISFDPNLRLTLWPDHDELKQLLDEVLPQCTVVKLSTEETGFALGTTEVEASLRELQRRGVRLPVVTAGEGGAAFFWDDRVHAVPAPRVQVVDTTGAGDGFTAGMLFGLSRGHALKELRAEQLNDIVRLGCEVGSRVVQALGASAALPTRTELAPKLADWLRA